MRISRYDEGVFDKTDKPPQTVDMQERGDSSRGLDNPYHSGDKELEELIAEVKKDRDEMYNSIESDMPHHPMSGEPGIFVRYMHGHPLYGNSSGEEFFASHQKGAPDSDE